MQRTSAAVRAGSCAAAAAPFSGSCRPPRRLASASFEVPRAPSAGRSSGRMHESAWRILGFQVM